jgi:hypothetical protein
MIWNHLKDEKNTQLRNKILTGVFSARDLCTKHEIEICNPEKKEEVQLMQKRTFNQDKIKGDSRIIIKTTKGEEFVETIQDLENVN